MIGNRGHITTFTPRLTKNAALLYILSAGKLSLPNGPTCFDSNLTLIKSLLRIVRTVRIMIKQAFGNHHAGDWKISS